MLLLLHDLRNPFQLPSLPASRACSRTLHAAFPNRCIISESQRHRRRGVLYIWFASNHPQKNGWCKDGGRDGRHMHVPLASVAQQLEVFVAETHA
jgi:hypothetical protein